MALYKCIIIIIIIIGYKCVTEVRTRPTRVPLQSYFLCKYKSIVCSNNGTVDNNS